MSVSQGRALQGGGYMQLLCVMGSVGAASPPVSVLTVPVLRADGGQYPSNQWPWHPVEL